jgi:hypothetical protein
MLSLRFITLIFLFSCASLTAPSEYVPSFNKAKTYPYGSYIELKTKGKSKISGEFIGISENNIFIRKGDTIYFLPIGDVKSIVIISNKPDYFGIGVLSTLTFLYTSYITIVAWKDPLAVLFLASPVWALSGLMFAIMVNEPVVRVKKLNKVIYFSRYPQGIPEEIKQKSIKLTNQ